MEEQELREKDYLNEVLGLFLVDTFHKTRRNRNDDNAECEAFASKDMKARTKMLGAVLKPGEHAHPFSSILYFYFPYKSLAFKKRRKQSCTVEHR